MDESAVRSLLDRVAFSDAPSTTVDIGKARRAGRRRLFARRAAWSALSAAMAGAVVVGAARTAIAPGKPTGPSGGTRVPASWPREAPARFNPLVPYATFGWLPAGYAVSADGTFGDNSEVTPTAEWIPAAGPRGDRVISLGAYPAGYCRLTGPVVWPPSGDRYPRGLYCGGPGSRPGPRSWPLALASRVPGFPGNGAYWSVVGSLVYRYAPRAWAEVSVTGPARASASVRRVLVKIAAHVRFARAGPLAYPFQLRGLPASWRPASSVLGVVDGYLVGAGLTLSLNPAGNLDVGFYTASSHATTGFCSWEPAQSRHVTADGTTGILRTLDEPGKYFQSLCFGDFHGLELYITRDYAVRPSGSPLATAEASLGVLGLVRHHLRMLGPDPAGWTSPTR